MAKEENKANWELTAGNRGQKDGIKVLPDGGYGFSEKSQARVLGRQL